MTDDGRPIDPQEVVDLWHEDDSSVGIMQRQGVREEWPALCELLDYAEPSFNPPEPKRQPAGEPKVRITNEGAVWIGLFMFFVGMGVGMALQFGVLNRWDAQ